MRKVSVGLEADVAAFIRPVIEATKSVDGLGNKVDGLDRSINKIPPDAAKAGAAMKLLGGDAHGISKQFDDFGVGATNSLKLIDKKIEDTRANVKRFAEDFNRNGNLTSFDLWRAASKDLGGLERIKKQLTTALSDGAKDAGKSAGPSFMASLGIAAAGAAPLLGSVLGAAVIGGGGLGLIGLGIIGQAKNPAVRTAFSDLGAFAKEDLAKVTSAFGPTLVRGAAALGTELDKISPKLQTIFDRLAPVFDKLLGGGIGFFDRMLPGIDALSRAAGPVLGQLADELPRLGGALASMFQSISAGGPGAADGLHALFTVVDGLIVGVGKLIQGFEMLPGPMQAGLAIIGILTAAFLYLRPKVIAAKDAFDEMRQSISDSDSKMGELAKNAGIVAGALAVLQTISAAYGHSDTTGIDETRTALDKLAASADKSSTVTKHLDYDLGTLGSGGMAKTGNAIAGFTENLTGLGSIMDESLQHAQERIASIDAAMAAEVQNGNTEQAAAQFEMLAEAAKKQGISVDDLKNGLPQYQNALAEAAAANGKAGDSARSATVDYEAFAGALNHTAATADTAIGSITDKVLDMMLGLDRATLSFEESLTRLTESVKQNGNEFDIHKAKGQANRESVLAAIEANKRWYDQMIAGGSTVGEATAQYDANTEAIRKTAQQAHLTGDDVQALIDKYGKVPGDVNTEVGAKGLTNVLDNLNETLRVLAKLDGARADMYTYEHRVTLYGQYGADMGLGHQGNTGNKYGAINRAAKGGIFGPSSPGTLIAEPETGGEANIPLRGISQMRAMGLAQVVGNSYGFNVSAGGGGMPSHISLAATFIDAQTAEVTRRQAITWSLNRGRNPADFFTKA